jgi:hypothetical protein
MQMHQACANTHKFIELQCKAMNSNSYGMDLKSFGVTAVPVRLRPEAPIEIMAYVTARDSYPAIPLPIAGYNAAMLNA